jgi:Predicted Zn-dependent peptidases
MFRLSIDKEAHENEKKIIIEEIKRSGSNSGSPHFFRTPLEGHTVLGTPESINAASVEDLYKYYKDNYTPDHLAFIVYGQIDTDKAEKYIRKIFNDVKAVPADGNNYIDVNGFSMVNGGNSSKRNIELSIAYKTASYKVDTEASFKQNLVDLLLCDILEKRLSSYSEVIGRTNTNIGSVIPGNQIYNFKLSTHKEAKYTDMLDAFCYVMAQARQHGFSVAELSYFSEQRLAWYAKNKNNEHISLGQVKNYFQEGNVPLSGKEKYRLTKDILPTVTSQNLVDALEKVLKMHRNVNFDSTSVAFTPAFNKTHILQRLNTIYNINTNAYAFARPKNYTPKQQGITINLQKPEAGEVKSRTNLSNTLSLLLYNNGIRVIVNHSDNEKILLKLVGKDGLNVIQAGDRQYAQIVSDSFYDAYGSYEANDTYNIRRSWEISSKTNLSNYGFEYALTGKSSSFEQMLQIFYLSLTQPKPFENKDVQKKLERHLKHQRKVEERDVFVQVKSVSRLNMESDSTDINGLAQRLSGYRQLLSGNLHNSVLYISGKLPDHAESLISEYLGNLPVLQVPIITQQNFTDILPQHETVKEVEWNKDLVKVEYLFTGLPIHSLQLKDELIIQAIGQYSIMKMMEVLRDKYGLVYALGMTAETLTYPADFNSLSIRYMLDPKNAQRSQKIMLEEVIKPMGAGVISEDEFNKIKAMMSSLFVLSFYESKQLEGKWLSWALKYGKVPSPQKVNELINRISHKDMQQMMQKLVNSEKHFVILRVPKETDRD